MFINQKHKVDTVKIDKEKEKWKIILCLFIPMSILPLQNLKITKVMPRKNSYPIKRAVI